MTYGGTDFLVYGLNKEWYLRNPQIMDMKKSEELDLLRKNGALVIQAHPYREASYIDHIRLYPRAVHGVEVINACRTDFENEMARIYAENYNLIKFVGSDNHQGKNQTKLAGVSFEASLIDELDFVEKVKRGEMEIFSIDLTSF